jgi:hypothetical protein
MWVRGSFFFLNNSLDNMQAQKASCALLILLMLSSCAYHSRFTDRELEARFHANEADFNRLVQMMKQDSQLTRLSHHAAYLRTDVTASLPQQRFDDYRACLSKLKVARVFRDPLGHIYFAVWNKDDFLMGGSNEYFVYAEDAPAEEQYIVRSLDELRKQTDASAFKKIADQWYLYVDNW